jgi:hypothetical protein
MHQRNRPADAMATMSSTQASDIPAPATPAQAIDTAAIVLPGSNTQDTEMQDTVLNQLAAVTTANESFLTVLEPPLAMQPPRHTHTDSSSAGPSRHTAEIPDQSHVHQPHSGQTNWRKLKEQARKDRLKRREVLIAVNPKAFIWCPRDSNKENSPDDNN